MAAAPTLRVMSLTGATLFIAIATTVLAVGSGFTAWYARRAFKKQSETVADGREMLQKQNDMLEVQSDRLEVYRTQVADQHKINERYSEVLGLQAREIQASLDQRKQAAEEERRSQAAKVTTWLARSDDDGAWEARIRNASDLPIFDVRTFFHKIHKVNPTPGGGNWVPAGQEATPPDETICVFPPQADRVVAVPENARKMFGEPTDRTYVASIEFTDAAGHHWERDARGTLTPRS
jgi:hypothetical protein